MSPLDALATPDVLAAADAPPLARVARPTELSVRRLTSLLAAEEHMHARTCWWDLREARWVCR